MEGTWYFGASINLVGSILINLGTNVMKLGHNKRAALEIRTGKNFSIRKFQEWQLGVVLFVAGNIANFISFGYAAQSLLAALGSVQFLSNVFFASMVLNEKVTRNVVVSTVCISAGCVGLVFFGSHESKQFTVDELMDLYYRPVYISYILFTVVIVTATYGVYKIGKSKAGKNGIGSLSPGWYRLFPVSYALFSGLLGTQSVVFSKTISTLLRVTLGGSSQMGSWFTWTIVGAFLCTSTFWVTRLNKISWTLFSIVSGMLYFEEYKGFTIEGGCLFGSAVMVVFFGVYLLTRDRQEETDLEGKYMGHRRFGSLNKGLSGMQETLPDEHAPLTAQASISNLEMRSFQGSGDEDGSLLGDSPKIVNSDARSPMMSLSSQSFVNQNIRSTEGVLQQTENQFNGSCAFIPESTTDFSVVARGVYNLPDGHKQGEAHHVNIQGVPAVSGSAARSWAKAKR